MARRRLTVQKIVAKLRQVNVLCDVIQALGAAELNCVSNCFNGEILYTLKETQIIIEIWRQHYGTCIVAGISTTGTGSSPLTGIKAGGANTSSKLTFRMDHSVEASHSRSVSLS